MVDTHKLVNPERCEVCKNSASTQVVVNDVDHFYCDKCLPKQGAFEELVSKIERLLPAEGGWCINEDNDELVVHTTVSRDPRRNRNGGEYDFYTCFALCGDGVLVYESTSCELHIDGMGRESGYVIPVIVGLDGLRRIAALVGLRAACVQFLKRGIGFADLRAAIEAAA